MEATAVRGAQGMGEVRMDDLKTLIKGEIETEAAVLKNYSRDASLFEVMPQAVVHPKDVEDIKALVHYAAKNAESGVSLTVRAGGSDMGGGPLGESIILDSTAHFSKIGGVEGDEITVEPGVFYRDFEKVTLAKNLLLPCFPASRELCTVGGMVANNAGGEKSLTYGKTNRYVRRLKAVLADGNEYTVEPLSKSELEEKIKQNNFEGTLYRDLYQLLEDNYELIQKSRPTVSKDSTGYALWNVWDKKTFDLTQLFVGSQGTLGIITEIKFALVRPKPHAKLLVIFLHDLTHLALITKTMLSFKPESFESYDDHTLKLAVKYFPEILKSLKTNILSLAWKFIPEFSMILRGGMPKLILLVEFTGDNAEDVAIRSKAALESLSGLNVRKRLTHSRAEARKYWVIRRESFNLLRHHMRDVHTAPFIDDIVVRPEHLPEFLPKLESVLAEYKLTYTIAGHVGDGNFHIIPLMNLKDPETKTIVFDLADKVYELVFAFKGSMSGEHNDGLIRSRFLPKMYGEQMYGLFKKTKEIFDPHNIFNPGKKIGTKIAYLKSHFETS
ncbi:MAG: FAD-binding oxidoreductase [bacterium]|nr:FAD-binding oxidoreductase [bacterium]